MLFLPLNLRPKENRQHVRLQLESRQHATTRRGTTGSSTT
jgi:hypothetical protein